MFKRLKKNLIHIVYVSFSDGNLTESDLDELLFDVRERNKVQKVTGLLLYNDGSFIQLIEGPKEVIEGLFEKIKVDKRHSNIVLLLNEKITKRAFPDWTMGYVRLNNEQGKNLPGFSDFMESEEPSVLVSKTTKEAIRLLNSFKVHT